jgi:hypothetical protein
MADPPAGKPATMSDRASHGPFGRILFRTDRGRAACRRNARGFTAFRAERPDSGPGRRRIRHAQQAGKARVHRLRGFLDGHQSGLDRIVDGPALEPPGQRDGRRLVVG